MLFSSTVFLYLFLPAVLVLYYTVCKFSRVLQNVFLLAASLLFYAWGEPKFVLIMICSIIINWVFGLLIDKFDKNILLKRTILGIDVALNIGILFVYKYLNFTCDIFNRIFGIKPNIPEILLPIGISFFTFQAMSYVLDVYKKNAEVQKNLLYLGLYISFFPQLIAGPIVRYETVAEEIVNRRENLSDFCDGVERFIIGLAKKVLLANNFALLADKAFDTDIFVTDISVSFAWLCAIAYALQIFFDFSGYSDMAIGLGKMFGFHFLENFNFPYISTSVSEFWRRWHISLGTWFRDYLYFPLGGSRVSLPRNIFNLFVVWCLTGLWHGANFTFIAWGLMYFVLIAFEKTVGFEKKFKGKLLPLRWVYTMLFVLLGWVIFRCPDIRTAIRYIMMMTGACGNAFSDGVFTGYLTQNAILLIIGIVVSTPIIKRIAGKMKGNIFCDILHIVLLCGIFVLSVAMLVSSSYNPFIYFNF